VLGHVFTGVSTVNIVPKDAMPSNPAPAVRVRHVLRSFRSPGFARLFGVRIAAQFGDGVFQASLAGAVLFNPERQAHASDIAAGFAVLLLPYSLVGPFTGVLIDRFSRVRILVFANLIRALVVVAVAAEIASGLHGQPFYATALIVLSVSRFLLSALSASLPHVVEPADLVTANALSTTAGTLSTTAGGAVAIGVRALVGGTSHSYSLLALAATAPYLLSAALALPFSRDLLGPDESERGSRERAVDIVRGLVAGARHLRSRPPALLALSAITAQRLCYGLWAVSSVLLYRNYYHADGPLRVGLSGLAQFVVAVAVGGGLAALVTPTTTRRIGYSNWAALLLAFSGVFEIAFGLPYRLLAALASALLLGFTAQGVKVCVDTTVQNYIDDDFRGRVFTFYDTLFNLALVVAAVITAVALPDSGHSPAAVIALGISYVAIAAVYFSLAAGRRSA
jgi:MFS family permease